MAGVGWPNVYAARSASRSPARPCPKSCAGTACHVGHAARGNTGPASADSATPREFAERAVQFGSAYDQVRCRLGPGPKSAASRHTASLPVVDLYDDGVVSSYLSGSPNMAMALEMLHGI